jgi:hypothetical protein
MPCSMIAAHRHCSGGPRTSLHDLTTSAGASDW